MDCYISSFMILLFLNFSVEHCVSDVSVSIPFVSRTG